MLVLRDYQREAVDAVIQHTATSLLPCLVILPTASGKSLVVGSLAAHFGTALCLQPSKELVAQNAAKCGALGVEHTLYCAGLGEKDFTGPVVLGTGASVRKDLDKLPHVSVLIIDEAHTRIAEAELVANALRERNPDLIIVGLTATAYALGRGYIYCIRPDGSVWDEKQAKKPFYSKCVYEKNAVDLVRQGYLASITVGAPAAAYDTSGLVIERGRFTDSSIRKAMRKNTTFAIVEQLQQVMQTRNRCMVFASSVDHAAEVAGLLGRRARYITGETPAAQRDHYTDMFQRGRIKFLVNVATLTTGYDCPPVDTIAIMRPSDSASLIEQIKGRGMRLSPDTGKTDCLLLDFGGNIERFYPAGDIYTPQIQACSDKLDGVMLPVQCPLCSHVNEFKAMPNDEGLMISTEGHFMTLDGHPVRDENGREIPAHYGRRCRNTDAEGVQCEHRWVGKKCIKCQHENDIAARKCQCGARLVDWNKALTKAASEINTTQLRRGWTGERVVQMRFKETNSWIRADLYVASRKGPLSVFLKTPESHHHMRQNMPYAVAWKKTDVDSHYPSVKVIWDYEMWERER